MIGCARWPARLVLLLGVLAGLGFAVVPPAASAAARSTDVCRPLGEAGETSYHHVTGGSRTTYDREASLFHVCEGFGAPDDVHFSPQMKCALLAAAATFGGPPVNVATDRLCDAVAIGDAYRSGNWLGAAAGHTCGYFAEVFAGGVGTLAAGAAAETGPGALAVGLGTYRALAASLKVACAGLLDGGARALGVKLESDHERHIAVDVVRKGRCITLTRRFGQLHWAAARCPRTAKVVFGRSTGPYQHGLGAPHPPAVDYGGDGVANMSRLRWRNWGGREAFGAGNGAWVWPGQSVATGTTAGHVEIVLSRIRTCDGVRAYTRMVRWLPDFGQHYHPEDALDLCSDKIPPYVPPASCPDVAFPDGAAATGIQVRNLACSDADALILRSPAEDYLRTGGGRYMQDGFFCGTDGFADPTLYTPDPGPWYGCELDQRWLLFSLAPGYD
jgi:hypothetical protein